MHLYFAALSGYIRTMALSNVTVADELVLKSVTETLDFCVDSQIVHGQRFLSYLGPAISGQLKQAIS
jgi:hypothetical protein